MNSNRMLQRAYESLGRARRDEWETIFEGAYSELMATCEIEQVDILEILGIGASRAGVPDAEVQRVVNRLRDGEIVIPLTELINPALMVRT
jgi:hypothetical protein